MNKIIQAVNSMIVNKEKISNAGWVPDSEWILFLYNNKYKWAMKKQNEDYLLLFLKTDENIEKIREVTDWEYIASICYSSQKLGTKEAIASFSELYKILEEKVLGIDEVLDEIIDDNPFA